MLYHTGKKLRFLNVGLVRNHPKKCWLLIYAPRSQARCGLKCHPPVFLCQASASAGPHASSLAPAPAGASAPSATVTAPPSTFISNARTSGPVTPRPVTHAVAVEAQPAGVEVEQEADAASLVEPALTLVVRPPVPVQPAAVPADAIGVVADFVAASVVVQPRPRGAEGERAARLVSL